MTMSMIKQGLAALFLFGATLFAAQAQEQSSLTEAQQNDVRKLVRETLIENPEIIAEALNALREREMIAAEAEAKKALAARRDAIFSNPSSPVLGNPEGDVAIVEFFDYRCPYCKALADSLFDVMGADGKIKLIMKELPVLGPDSLFASRAALAAQKQGKYLEFHRALMAIKGPINEAVVLKAASDLKLDVAKLKADMGGEDIDKAIADNIELAQALGLQGAPALIIGEQIIPGAVTQQQLKQLIMQRRAGK